MSSLRRDLVERKLWMVVAILIVAVVGRPRGAAQGRLCQHHPDRAGAAGRHRRRPQARRRRRRLRPTSRSRSCSPASLAIRSRAAVPKLSSKPASASSSTGSATSTASASSSGSTTPSSSSSTRRPVSMVSPSPATQLARPRAPRRPDRRTRAPARRRAPLRPRRSHRRSPSTQDAQPAKVAVVDDVLGLGALRQGPQRARQDQYRAAHPAAEHHGASGDVHGRHVGRRLRGVRSARRRRPHRSRALPS